LSTDPSTDYLHGDYPDDAALAAALLANEPSAVARVAGWVREITRFRAWGFEGPEDVAQEALLALVRNLRAQRFREGDLRAYARRIAKNLCISSYRRYQTRRGQVPLDEETPLADAGRSGATLERRAMVRRILDRLDEACRELITLAYYHGLSRREIAGRLGVSEGTAKVRLFRCIEKARLTQDGS
jgi:RNA polymerase sigma-70 factor (ECF subfamily)